MSDIYRYNGGHSVFNDWLESEREFYNKKILKYKETIQEALNKIRKISIEGSHSSWEHQQLRELYEFLEENNK